MTNKKNRIANELLTLILSIEIMLGFWYLLNFKGVAHAILFFIICVLPILGLLTFLASLPNNVQVCQPYPNTPAHKENTNNNPVKQIFSPNISEVDKLTKQIESIKNDFKIINHEVDNSIFNQFNLLKKNLYLEYDKINWKENTNKEISEKYQTVIDSYVEAMNNEYLKIKQQFTDILNNEIKSKIDNVEKQCN